MNGNEPGKFGAYEFVKSLHWLRLAAMVAATVLGWMSTDAIPQLQGYGGRAAAASAVLAYIVNAASLAIQDNSGKSLK